VELLGRPARFLLAGAWNTGFGLAVFTALHLLLGGQLGYVLTLAVAQVVAVVQAHLVQRRFVWRSREPYFGQLLRFSVLYVFVYVANVLLLSVAVEWGNAPILPAQYVIGGVLIVTTYFAQRAWTFRASTTSASIPGRS
jgi:putative flippase GtrA